SAQHAANKRSKVNAKAQYSLSLRSDTGQHHHRIFGEGTVKHGAQTADGAAPPSETAPQRYERLLERMVDRLPGRLQTVTRWLRRPALRLVRLVSGVLFIAGAFLR